MDQKTFGAETSEKPKHRYQCIITVHGIGESKPNATLMPVVEQISKLACADMRGDTLTLGGITDLKGWDPVNRTFKTSPMRFHGVQICDPVRKGPVWLQPPGKAENVFFADIHWADTTRSVYEQVGEPLSHWTECLLNRVERNKERHEAGGKTGRWWVMDFLDLMRSTILFLEKMLSWKAKGLSNMVFGQYLGDVQMYAESAFCRGQSVRVFHDTMKRIHEEIKASIPEIHAKDAVIEYTILAHSLGTVLSMDALMLAHYDFSGKPESENLPFPGYGAAKDSSHLDWIGSVKSFVTLGSPIDKFLTLWWYNYLYLLKPDWIRNTGRSAKINHFNFCEEQDPVGHRLDFARTAPAFTQVFSSGAGSDSQYNDIVYSHSPVPGLAHTYYWKDDSLFKLIFDLIIIGDRKSGEPLDLTRENLKGFPLYKEEIFRRILSIHFFLVPLLCIAAVHYTLFMALNSQNWNAKMLGAVGLIVSLVYGRTLLKLNIAWRRALKDDPGDRKAASASASQPAKVATDRLKNSMQDEGNIRSRERLSSRIQKRWWALAILCWLAGFFPAVSLYNGPKEDKLLLGFGVPVLLLTAIVAVILISFRNNIAKFRKRPFALPPSIQKELNRTRLWEILVAAMALAPSALILIGPLRDLVTAITDSVKACTPTLLLSIARDSRLFFATLFQVSALGWGELIVLHHRAKRRATTDADKGEAIPEWQRDFVKYAQPPAHP